MNAFGSPSRLRAIVRLWLRRWEERRSLAELDDHLLRDLGLSRADVAREGSRPFWCGDDRSGLAEEASIPSRLSAPRGVKRGHGTERVVSRTDFPAAAITGRIRLR